MKIRISEDEVWIIEWRKLIITIIIAMLLIGGFALEFFIYLSGVGVR